MSYLQKKKQPGNRSTPRGLAGSTGEYDPKTWRPPGGAGKKGPLNIRLLALCQSRGILWLGIRPSAKSPYVKTGIVVSRGSAAAREGLQNSGPWEPIAALLDSCVWSYATSSRPALNSRSLGLLPQSLLANGLTVSRKWITSGMATPSPNQAHHLS